MTISKASLNVPFTSLTRFICFKVDKLCPLILVIMLSSYVGQSQDQKRVDSLLQIASTQTDTTQIITYAMLWAEYLYVNPLASKPFLDSTVILANRLNHKEFIARTTNYSGVYHNMTYQNQKADSIFDVVIKMYTELNDMEQVSYALNNKALALNSMGRFKECLEVHMKSLKLKEGIGDTEESIAASYWNIGNIHGDIGNYDISNEYYNKAKAVFEKLNLKDDLASVNVNLALNLKNQKSSLSPPWLKIPV